MVKFGNYELNIPAGLLNSTIAYLFWGMIIFLVLGLIGWLVIRSVRKKITYTTPITLTTLLENGSKKTKYGLMGGKFTNRHNVWDFKIKIPKQWAKKELGYMPDFSLADADGSLHFITSGDGTIWQQVEEKIVVKEIVKQTDLGEETEYSYDLIQKPIRTDVKIVTVNSMKNWSEMVNKNKMTAFTLGLAIFIIMVVAHLISLYIQTKIRCPV